MTQPPTRLPFEVAPPPPELDRVLLVANARPLGWISDKIAGIVEGPTPAWWWWAFVPSALAPPDLSRWRKLSNVMMGAGALLCSSGLLVDFSRHHSLRQFGYSWLLAFMLWLSLTLGALFLVMMHHLFDAAWSVPVRRLCEHLACLVFPWMALFFIPVALLAPDIYNWMNANLRLDHALRAKWPLFTVPGFYSAAAVCFAVWGIVAYRLRFWSLRQDSDGAAQCTYRMRAYSAWGVVAYAFTLTLGAIMWMKGLQHQWYSTIYGVYYFSGCVWVALATAYVVAAMLDRKGLRQSRLCAPRSGG